MGITRYEIKEYPSDSVRTRLLYVTYSKFENDWASLLHTHPFTELVYITGGQGVYQVRDEKMPIHKDDFIIVNPNTPHTERSTGRVPLEYIILGVEDLSFSFEGNGDFIIFSCVNDKQDIFFYMNTMLNEMENKEKTSDRICQDLLEIVIIKLIRRTNFAFEVAPSIKISRECQILKRYLEQNYTRELSLDDLAEISHLNKYYLVHAFNKYCGCSPINYLYQVRIVASRELLVSTDYRISEVARAAGFSSSSYFAQCFQKSCGMTASHYRKMKRETEQASAAD